jgi:hypothetical protein
MTKKTKPKDLPATIATNIAAWDEANTVANFFKKKMGQDDNANKVANNIISKSLTEEKPEWTRLLIDSMKAGEDKKPEGPGTINFFQVASEQINNSVQNLINVTPKSKKTGIQSII